MDKLLRSLARKDPVHLAFRTSSLVLLSLPVLALAPCSAAETMRGHPAKTVRVSPLETTGEFRLPLRSLVLALLPPESPAAPARRSGYLPEAGATPLRFASPAGWPAPLPRPDVPVVAASGIEGAAEQTARLQPDPEPPSPPSVQGAAPEGGGAKVTTVAASSAARSGSALVASSGSRLLLSAEFVLGQLPQAAGEASSLPSSFLPAMPARPAELVPGPLAALE